MWKNHCVLIPSLDKRDQICDFVFQTGLVVSEHTKVIIVESPERRSLRSLWRVVLGRESLLFFVKKNLYYYTPIYFVPYHLVILFKPAIDLESTIVWLNYLFISFYLRLVHQPKKPIIVWLFFPQLFFVTQFFSQKTKVIFDIVDYFNSDSDFSSASHNVKRLLVRADVITSISKILIKYYGQFTTKKIHLVLQGFRKPTNQVSSLPITLPHNQKIVGFVGGVSNRLDVDLLAKVSRLKPDWNFVLVGPKHIDSNVHNLKVSYKKKFATLMKKPNVFWFDSQPKDQIPGIIRQFDVAMIPYDITQPFNVFCYPMKLFEYFYEGKPVISTSIEELKRFPELVVIKESAAEWADWLTSQTANHWPISLQQKQKKLALKNVWDKKVTNILKKL